MPGKVNPVIPEALSMVCAQVIGNDAAIAFGGAAGNFELNIMLPVLARNLLESIRLLASASVLFADRCVSGIAADEARAREFAEGSPSIATALNSVLGYEEVASIAKQALAERKSIRQVVIERGHVESGKVSLEDLDRLLDVMRHDPMKWITREHVKVDRVACPWLIRKYIDPEAEFLFVPAADVAAVAEREGATPFDVGGAVLGHRDGKCSFETIIEEYGLLARDPALARMAEIVHGADVSADLDRVPESRGLKAIAEGFGLVYADDHAILEAEFPLYDALHAWCARQV